MHREAAVYKTGFKCQTGTMAAGVMLCIIRLNNSAASTGKQRYTKPDLSVKQAHEHDDVRTSEQHAINDGSSVTALTPAHIHTALRSYQRLHASVYI